MQNHYETLGVAETATQEEIKKAFKKKALESHPDTNPDDPTAEKRFVAINEAHQVLGDEAKRAAYDQQRKFPNSNVNVDDEGFGFSVEDFFRQAGFRSGFPFGRNTHFVNIKQQRPKVETFPVRVLIELTLDEVFKEQDRTVTIPFESSCKHCDAKGWFTNSTATKTIPCEDCGGKGKTRSVNPYKPDANSTQDCKPCEGTGKLKIETCFECNGEKTKKSTLTHTFRIPAGIHNGLTNVLQGFPFPDDSKRTIQVQIHVKPHAVFQRDGNDLHVEHTISFADAVLGTELKYHHVDGSDLEIKIPAGIESEQSLRLAGKGTPFLENNSAKGDFYMTFKIEVPKVVTDKQREFLEQFKTVFSKQEQTN